MELNKIYNEDCTKTSKRLTANSVDMIVTSPPHFNLRDYAHAGQIGLESTPEEYVSALVKIFAAYRPALKETGTLWLNIGDTYATRPGGYGNALSPTIGQKTQSQVLKRKTTVGNGIKSKDMIGIPWMLALALRADGWYLRQDIIWAKPNPMPESVTDRCTKSHEYIFLLSKNDHYYFDHVAIREASVYAESGRQSKKRGEFNGKTNELKGRESFRAITDKRNKRNKRSVWNVATKPFTGAHFAVYPHELITPCIMAGTSERGNCNLCGTPWLRIVEPIMQVGHTGTTGSTYDHKSTAGRLAKLRQAAREQGTEYTGEKKTIGWGPGCCCKDNIPIPALVCDPFMGSGTTASVAKSLGRNYIGSELNPEYMSIIDARLSKELGLFNQ